MFFHQIRPPYRSLRAKPKFGIFIFVAAFFSQLRRASLSASHRPETLRWAGGSHFARLAPLGPCGKLLLPAPICFLCLLPSLSLLFHPLSSAFHPLLPSSKFPKRAFQPHPCPILDGALSRSSGGMSGGTYEGSPKHLLFGRVCFV